MNDPNSTGPGGLGFNAMLILAAILVCALAATAGWDKVWHTMVDMTKPLQPGLGVISQIYFATPRP